MKERIFLKAIMAGLYIGIAGLVYLSVSNKIVGSFLFSTGLLMVVAKGYFLYTGKIGYLLPYQKGFIRMILLTILGNFVGIALVGVLFLFTGKTEVVQLSEQIMIAKLTFGPLQTLILAIFCGMLMYTGVHGYKSIENPIIKVLIVILAVMIFILAGFEHSIANLLYVVLARSFTFQTILYVILWILGNLIGAVALNLVEEKLNLTKA
ncbi:MAG: formate/nitrite transporter family protein [Acholeplasmataceae bacterium]|nr:formate/nitrite transporter family protein [Acholeplasmataceae bacterium]